MYLLLSVVLIAVLLGARLFQRAFPFESLGAFAMVAAVVLVLLEMGKAG